MKILAIGDFHGKFPNKLINIIKRKDIDLILSPGDFANADKIRKLIFKNWADKKWYEAIGEKKAEKLEKESFYSGLKVLRDLNRIKKTFIVWGNTDFYKDYIKNAPPIIMPGFYNNNIKKMENIRLIDRKKIKINNLEIIGHGGYADVTEFIKHPIDKDKEKRKDRLIRYKKSEKELFNLFKNKKPKNFIFLIHYTPYKYLDKVKFKGSPMNGKHVGFEPYNKVIKKYKPFLVICGHMHENQGKARIGRSIILNPGAAGEGKAAIIDIDEQNKKVKNIKFIK